MISELIASLLPVAAWGSVAFIAYATLAPIEARPAIARAEYEHIAAFALATALFCLAYPRHALVILLLLSALAAVLEACQLMVPGRHGRIVDMLRKWIGIGVGALIFHFVKMLDSL
jgi:VanZ family protein